MSLALALSRQGLKVALELKAPAGLLAAELYRLKGATGPATLLDGSEKACVSLPRPRH